MDAFGAWLETTRLSHYVTGHSWVWPTCETLHFIGLALLFGNVGLLDLRLLGVAKRLPVAPLGRFIRWGVLGFVINLVTGALFFIGTPSQYLGNIAFQLKLLLIVLAGVNLVVFYVTGVGRQVEALGAGDDAPAAAKVIAATSLVLWVGVMFFGRMLPFIGNSF